MNGFIGGTQSQQKLVKILQAPSPNPIKVVELEGDHKGHQSTGQLSWGVHFLFMADFT